MNLSPRQVEVLKLIAEDRTTNDIASRLGLSCKTVEFHRVKLKHRLHIFGIAGLTRYAIKNGLIQL